MAILSVLGMYKYDNSLFDGLFKHIPTPNKMPAKYPSVNPIPIDKEALTAEILTKCAEFGCIYSDYYFLKWYIERWALAKSTTWQGQYNTLWYDYCPIWNKDGTITETMEGTDNRNTEISKNDNIYDSDNETRNLNYDNTGNESGTGTSSIDNNILHKVAGYNSESLQTDYSSDESSTRSTSATNDITNNSTESGTITREHTSSGDGTESTTDSGKNERTISRLEQGNIGVTTTQRMLEEERKTVLYNIYDIISEDFKKRFCIMVY